MFLKVSPESSLLRAEQIQLSQPVLTGEVLHPSRVFKVIVRKKKSQHTTLGEYRSTSHSGIVTPLTRFKVIEGKKNPNTQPWESTGAPHTVQQWPPWPELLRSIVSPARKAAAALDTQCTWEKCQNQRAVALYMQSLARDRLESRTTACVQHGHSWKLPNPLVPSAQAQLPLAAAFSGHQLAPGGALTKGPCPFQATTASYQLEQKTANMRLWWSLYSGWKIGWRLYFPVYCSHHHHVPRWKTAV